jgi:integrase
MTKKPITFEQTQQIPTDKRTADDVLRFPARHDYYFSDCGLVLAVETENSRRFYVKYQVKGRPKSKTWPKYNIGSAKLIPLDVARAKAKEVRMLAAQGIDIKEKEAADMAAKDAIPTFRQYAKDYMDATLPRLKNQNSRDKWRNSIANHCGKILDMPVDKIELPNVMAVLEPIWHKVPVQASELRGRIERILGHAATHGKRDINKPNPASWAILQHGLSKPPASGSTRGSHKSVDRNSMPGFMEELRNFREGTNPTARCLEVTVLTALRTQEVTLMKKDELDLDAGVWVIPYERFKVCDHGNDFDVPLSPRCVEVLKAQIAAVEDAYGVCDYVFPGRDPTKPISNAAMLRMLQRDMGFAGEATVHGFRASFQTWAENQKRDGARLWADREIDRCLAHNKGVKSRRAYSRDTLFELREPIMMAWEQYLAPKKNVTPIRNAA